MKEALKVGVSGVRGVVGDSFSPQVAASFAQAFGTFVGQGPVVVGRDTRSTGLMVEYAVIAGLQSVGCKPVLAGIVPTPTLLVLTKHLGAFGGIAITASHNPSQWNALKFVDRNGLFLSEMRAEELFDIYHQQDFTMVEESAIARASFRKNPFTPHLRRIMDYIDADSIRTRRLKVAVDCCNGVGCGLSAPFLEEQFGCEVVTIHDDPTKAFEREPEPLPENLSKLAEVVIKEKCDIGFAQDPDGDRLAIVNEKGKPIGEDMTLAFAVEQVLSAHGKGVVAANLSCSKAVEFVAAKYACEVVRTRIGEINVSEKMLEIGAVVGGENNGGVIIPKIHPCRDSFGGMAVILELMARTGKTVSELRAEIPEYHVVKEKIRVRSDQAPTVLRALRRTYESEKITLIDGVHVDFGDHWIHARRSNTEPVIRVMAESLSLDQSKKLCAELRREVEDNLR